MEVHLIFYIIFFTYENNIYSTDEYTNVVAKDGVYFAYYDETAKHVKFTKFSSDTAFGVGPGAADLADTLAGILFIILQKCPLSFTSKELQAGMLDEFTKAPMLDTVKRWVAPYTGNIVINVEFKLNATNAAPTRGVRATVQINRQELMIANLDKGNPHGRTIPYQLNGK